MRRTPAVRWYCDRLLAGFVLRAKSAGDLRTRDRSRFWRVKVLMFVEGERPRHPRDEPQRGGAGAGGSFIAHRGANRRPPPRSLDARSPSSVFRGSCPEEPTFTCNDGCCVHAHHSAVGASGVVRPAGTLTSKQRAAASLPGTLAVGTDVAPDPLPAQPPTQAGVERVQNNLDGRSRQEYIMNVFKSSYYGHWLLARTRRAHHARE